MGVPVVASDVGIPSIIKPGETGRLMPPHDAAALACAIHETLEQKIQTQAMCRAGQRFVMANSSLDAMLDQLDAIYRRHLEASDEPCAGATPSASVTETLSIFHPRLNHRSCTLRKTFSSQPWLKKRSHPSGSMYFLIAVVLH